ncbi:MAG: flagellar hook-length control protein FliK [Sulfurimonas sp.]|nr:flagellar hook-length control protein FliK [Sulfurimonas sp.]
MINISTSSKLGIILPNTNKALAKVLSSATPKELEIISNGKDLKSVMSTILKQSGNSSSSDKALLELVKNNPTLKNLGDVSTTIKDLLNSIKSDKEQLPIEKTLKNFLTDIKDLKNSELKQKLENSGVFLESRLKNAKNPQVELKNTLTLLVKTLQNSSSPSAKAISNQVKILLNNEILKSASNLDITKEKPANQKILAQLSSSIENLISKLKTAQKGIDTIHNPTLNKTLEKLEHLIQVKNLTPKNFKLSSIKESLEQISLNINKSFTMESKSIINSLEKIFQSLKSIDSVEKFIDKNLPSDISKLNQNIKDVILKADPIFSKDTNLILNKLQTLNTPEKLNSAQNVKEIISSDLKAILMQTSEEMAKSPHANQNEILKYIDKLSLQIDHYQLLSHLSNGSSLYLPFSWDMLEDGNIELKKDEDEKFYCDIDLKLKEYGALNLKLTLFEKNQLNLHIYSSSEKLKTLLKENIPSLRSALIDIQVTPREIRVYEPKIKAPISPYQNQEDNIYMGFEVKA